MRGSDYPYAPWLNRVLFMFSMSRGPQRFVDAMKVTGDGGIASWALYFLTKLNRVKEEDGSYTVVNSTPVVESDWTSISMRKHKQEAGMESEAVIEESDQVNEHGRYQDCVVARCIVTDEEAMAWGTSERSIKRALRELTERCECGADWHSEAE